MEIAGVCDSPLWNQTVSWDTRDPYISECFKHLILVIGSCGVLWIIAPFEFVKICRYRGSPAPWSTLSITKIVCKVLLLIVCSIDLGKEIYAYRMHIKTGLDGLIAALAYFVTIVLTVIITMMCKRRGLRSSIALPSFWMISTIATVISIYDDIHFLDQSNWVSMVSLVDDSLTFLISVLQLFLSNMSERGTSPSGRDLMNYCPLDGCTLFSRLTYSWLYGMLMTSQKKTLHTDDLIPLCSEFRSVFASNSFSEIWNTSETSREDSTSSFSAEDDQRNLDFSRYQRIDNFDQHEKKRNSLFKCLFKISSKYLMISALFEMLYVALYYLPVIILSLLLKGTEEPKWHFYMYVVALFVVLLFTTIVNSQRKYYSLISALKFKTALMNAAFEKALISQQFQNAEKRIKEDAEYIFQMVCLLNEVWSAPIRIIIGVYLLWLVLGTSCFIGVGIGALLIPIVTLAQNITNLFKAKALVSKSKWLNMLSECLQGIKCLKFYSWEDVFLQKIKTLRHSETKKIRKATFFKIISKLIILCSVSMVTVAAFTYFVLVTDSFDLKIIFLSFVLICLLKVPFSNILRILAHFTQGLHSISQVQNFLENENVENFSQSNGDSECGILLQNATFAWTSNSPFLLSNITINIGKNSLVAIVGESKNGKTSFLRALLGEMKNLAGSVFIRGEICFVSDNSWIQNTTLEENILFGKPKIEDFYRKTLDSCYLLQDIENLPQADETQIGKKGYPLNNEQKWKVELARAVYQNGGIYLIDDLSRITDTSTAELLFEKVIGRHGILSDKIRIFTTSNIKLLPLVDYIVFLKDGEILEQGKYSELLNKKGHFAEYLKNDYSSKHLQTERENSFAQNEVTSSKNQKHILDPWISTIGLSLKTDVNNFFKGEVTTEPKSFIRKMMHYVQVNGYMIALLAILTAILGNCCEVASLTWLAWDTSKHESARKMYMDIYTYAGFILAEVLFFLICGVIICYGNTLSIRKFYGWLLDRIIKAPFMAFGTTFVEKVLHSFDNDLQYVDEEIPVGIFVWLITMFKLPVLLVVIFLQYPILFLLLLYIIPSVYFVQRLYMNAWRQLHYLSASTYCPLINFVENTFQGISNIRTSNKNSYFISQFRIKLDKHNKCHFLFMLVSKWLCNSVEIIGNTFIFLVALVLVYGEIHKSSNSTGIALIYSLQISECLIAFIYLSSTLDIDLTCLERLMSFSNVKPEIEFENQTSAPWLTSGSIIIRNLKTDIGERFYPVLGNICISLRPREKVAIIGNEISGISTILDSIFRIRKITEGYIFIDNNDIALVNLHDLRSKLAIIPQDPLLFNDTLQDNLDPEQNYSEEDLQFVFKKSGLDSCFTNLTDVIYSDTNNDEKYQIALARCLLKKPKIVIVEGSENYAAVQHFPNSTLLLFGNSQVLDGYNRIIYMSSGEIVKMISCPS